MHSYAKALFNVIRESICIYIYILESACALTRALDSLATRSIASLSNVTKKRQSGTGPCQLRRPTKHIAAGYMGGHIAKQHRIPEISCRETKSMYAPGRKPGRRRARAGHIWIEQGQSQASSTCYQTEQHSDKFHDPGHYYM